MAGSVARELVTLIRYEVDASGLNKLPQQVAPGIDKVTNAANRSSNAVSRLGGILRGVVAGVGLLAITRMADEWAGVEGRVGLVTDGIQQQKAALEGLYQIAQATGQEYTATAGLFQAVQRNGKELNLTLDQSLKLTDTIGRAMAIGGGSAASQQAALMQLGQALGTGTLRGEELNSIMEQAPRLAQAIAEAFGTTTGKLKELGQSGKLTSKVLAAGLLKQSEKLNAEFERMPMTFGRAFTRLKNSLGQQVDRLNKNTRAAEIFYKVTSLIVDNLGQIVKWLAFLGAAAGLTKLAYAARTAGGAVGVLGGLIARLGGGRAVGLLIGTFIRMLAIVTAIQYVFGDIAGWIRGDLSLLGDVIGPMSEWKGLADGVAGALTFIKDLLGGTTTTLADWVAKWGLISVIIFGIVAALGLIPTLVVAATVALAGMFNWLRKNWDAIPEWVRKVITVTAGVASGPFGSVAAAAARIQSENNAGGPPVPGTPGMSPFIGPGGAAFGITPGALPQRSMGGNQVVTNNANVTVNAQTPTPAAVGDAARRGTEQGLGASLVPMVEARP